MMHGQTKINSAFVFQWFCWIRPKRPPWNGRATLTDLKPTHRG